MAGARHLSGIGRFNEKLIANTTPKYARHSQQCEREGRDDAHSISDVALFLNFYFLTNMFEKAAKLEPRSGEGTL